MASVCYITSGLCIVSLYYRENGHLIQVHLFTRIKTKKKVMYMGMLLTGI